MRRSVLLAGFLLTLSVNGWCQPPTLNGPLNVTLNDPTGGTSSREMLADGTVVVQTSSTQPVATDVAGTFSEVTTQQFALADEQGAVSATTLWTLESPAGTLRGYYSGLRNRNPNLGRDAEQHGSVLLATGVYAAYHQATVTYRLTPSGPLQAWVTIVPRIALNNDLISTVEPTTPPGAIGTPSDATADPDGTTLYFTAIDNNGVPGLFTVPALGGAVTTVFAGAPFVSPRGVASSQIRSGALYVADPQAGDDRSGRIFVVEAGKSPTVVAGTAGYAPQGLEVAREEADDVIYFTGRDPRDSVVGLFKVHANGTGPVATVHKGAPLVEPDGVAVSRTGAVYVSDRSASGNGRGSVFLVREQSLTRITTGFVPGNPAGIALDQSDAVLMVSSIDAQQGTAQILLVDLETFRTGVANKVISANRGAGGLHRARFNNVYPWVSAPMGPIYKVMRISGGG